jgi:hypothetical protein
LAGLTQAGKLKKVVVYSEPALSGEPFLQLAEVISCEIHHLTTVRANQVVVVLRSTDCIAVADTAGMQLADEFQLGQYLKRAVNGCQPDIGLLVT